MPDLTITDVDGDTIQVEPVTRSALRPGNWICVADEAVVTINADQSVKLAEALLENAERKLVPIADLKRASDVSFNEALLRVAAAHKRTVAFRYAKDKGGYIEARRLNPDNIVGEGDAVAAVGTDPDRGGPRRFRLDRIKGEVSFA